MNRNILFVIDDLEFKYFEFNDLITDFWLIREFLKRKDNVSVVIKRNLYVENFYICISKLLPAATGFDLRIRPSGAFFHVVNPIFSFA